jgi:hypothetical protein
VSLALLANPDPTTAPCTPDLARHWACESLPSRLNVEWRALCDSPDTAVVVAGWASGHPALAGLDGLESVLRRIAGMDQTGRDGVLLALLELARDGDGLASRVVLQAMLPKAVRVAMSVVRRPDVLGDREEAQARAVAALWQAIVTYPLAARPGRVAANLALDTLAVVQRGHTGSSHFAPTFPEQPFADLRVLGEATHHDVGPDDPAGPADAELFVLLAWGVRNAVLDLGQARLLARVYALDGRPADSRTIAAELGISWPALRQRCSRLARRLGQAAVAAGITPVGSHSPVLVLAA